MIAQANIEVPLWGEMLGIDPRSKQEVWDPQLDEDGRQKVVRYMRGDEVDQSNFRQEDWDALIESGALAEDPPEDDVVDQPPLSAGAEGVEATEDTPAMGESSEAGGEPQ